ncbi:MAG: acetate--CoA ligase [Verrucomicrobia bacterium]|nr:acetate--CoA ligase [Verrucomicrobiota bacterium]
MTISNLQLNSKEEYLSHYQQSVEHPEDFWAGVAEQFVWKKKWDKVLDYDWENARFEWFKGAQLNITENCLDRHLKNRAEQAAIVWEPNDPNAKNRILSYKELHQEVCRFSNVLRDQGIKKGDRICLYMPMIPELAIAQLASARVGAVHSIVFAGFSATAIASRIEDSKCKMLITVNEMYRGAKTINLKSICDEALKAAPSVEKVIVYEHTDAETNIEAGRDLLWKELVNDVSDHAEAESMDAEDLLFILYTSGSTGKPKGMVHHCGGYMIGATYTFLNVFQYKEGDIYWCTADIGWITGHSYIIYGPLAAGATTLMFEGVPTYPDAGRFWEIVEKYKVNQFYTAPTAIRALQKCSLSLVESKDLSSLKTLGTVGEPINEEAWQWYKKYVGHNQCPIVDTWWQTETGGIMISSLAGITDEKATYATLPLPGVQLAIMDQDGHEIKSQEAEGRLAIKFPWPHMARTIYGNHDRYKQVYFSAFEKMYFSGDGALRDKKGFYRITGRVDDVVIVSGHNLGTAPIEDAIDEHENVVETAIVGFPHEIKGNALHAFVILHDDVVASERLVQEIKELVSSTIGPIAKPDKIQFVSGLPKTRSGKIMRRILRKIASNDLSNLGDTSTLLNPEVVEDLINSKV